MSLRVPHVGAAATAREISESSSSPPAPAAAPARISSRRVSGRFMAVSPSYPTRSALARQRRPGRRPPARKKYPAPSPPETSEPLPTISPVLTDRQELVLRKVVDEYLAG